MARVERQSERFFEKIASYDLIIIDDFGICKYGVLVLLVVFVTDKTNEAFHYLDDAPVVNTSVVYPQMVKATHAILSFTGK